MFNSHYNTRSRTAPRRFQDETFLPGSNNGYTAGRAIDTGDYIDRRWDVERDNYDLSLQPDDYTPMDLDEEEAGRITHEQYGEPMEIDGEELFRQHVQACQQVSGAHWDYEEDASEDEADDADSDYVPSEAEETEDDTDYVDSDEDSDVDCYSVAQYLDDGTGYPDELDDEDYKRIDEYYESQKGNTPNDKLISAYFRPSFSESLHIDAAVLNTTTVNVQDPVAFENDMAFLTIKPNMSSLKLAILENLVVIWRGESQYNQDTRATELKCYFFYQDISPFMYDDWDFDDEDIDVIWLKTSSVSWLVPLEHKDRKFLEKMASWTPTEPFDRTVDATSYCEWENEFMDTQGDKAPRGDDGNEEEKVPDDSSHSSGYSSMPSLISGSESDSEMDISDEETDYDDGSHFGPSTYMSSHVWPKKANGDHWCDP